MSDEESDENDGEENTQLNLFAGSWAMYPEVNNKTSKQPT